MNALTDRRADIRTSCASELVARTRAHWDATTRTRYRQRVRRRHHPDCDSNYCPTARKVVAPKAISGLALPRKGVQVRGSKHRLFLPALQVRPVLQALTRARRGIRSPTRRNAHPWDTRCASYTAI
jgi:hypothetical protein